MILSLVRLGGGILPGGRQPLHLAAYDITAALDSIKRRFTDLIGLPLYISDSA